MSRTHVYVVGQANSFIITDLEVYYDESDRGIDAGVGLLVY